MILIRYSNDITKYFPIWAFETRQVIIVSKSYINKSKQDVKLLLKWPVKITITTSKTKQKAPASKPRPRERPKKIVQKIFNIFKKFTITTSVKS